MAVLSVSVVIVIGAVLIDPADHHDNRYDGWLT